MISALFTCKQFSGSHYIMQAHGYIMQMHACNFKHLCCKALQEGCTC